MKTIKLTQGKEAIVDDEDFEHLSQWKWYCARGYAVRNITIGKKTQRQLPMHRVILNAPNGLDVDHINLNPLDNRKENLRLCSRAQNIMHKPKNHKYKYPYKGIRYRSKGACSYWESRITAEKKAYSLGCYKTAEEAAMAYDRAAIKYHGEFAFLNFPKEDYNDR